MTSPSPYAAPSLWDQIQIGGLTWGGFTTDNPVRCGGGIEIRGATRFYKIDQKDGAGLDGATQTYRGQKPKPFDLIFSWWTDLQDAWWVTFSTQFNYSASKPGLPPPVFQVYHPKLARLNIDSILVEEVGGTDVHPDSKLATARVRVRQFLPPALVNASVTPLGTSVPSGYDNGQGAGTRDTSTATVEELQAHVLVLGTALSLPRPGR
jgi:hypothetical protein